MASGFSNPDDGDTVVLPVRLGTFDRLDPHSRSCVFWQTADDDHGARLDASFEKEAWLSSILLQWGVCGQVAENLGRTVGTATYGPSGSVPRSTWFPSGPVSSDAVVLAELHTVGTPAGTPLEGVRDALLDAVLTDVARRGVKAVETFGLTSEAALAMRGRARTSGEEMAASGTGARGGVRGAGECGPLGCMSPVEFFLERGFEVVADDERFPRLRLELDGEHQWQASVEHALDQLLLHVAPATTPERARA